MIEVKAATARSGTRPAYRPGLHLSADQAARLARAARALAGRTGYPDWRVELAEVLLTPAGPHIDVHLVAARADSDRPVRWPPHRAT